MNDNLSKHYNYVYKGIRTDPAFIARIYNLDPMLLQALKKILLAGKRGNKDAIRDLEEAKGAITRFIELEKDFTLYAEDFEDKEDFISSGPINLTNIKVSGISMAEMEKNYSNLFYKSKNPFKAKEIWS